MVEAAPWVHGFVNSQKYRVVYLPSTATCVINQSKSMLIPQQHRTVHLVVVLVFILVITARDSEHDWGLVNIYFLFSVHTFSMYSNPKGANEHGAFAHFILLKNSINEKSHNKFLKASGKCLPYSSSRKSPTMITFSLQYNFQI